MLHECDKICMNFSDEKMTSKPGEVDQHISDDQQEDGFSTENYDCYEDYIDIDSDIDERGNYIFFKSTGARRIRTNSEPKLSSGTTIECTCELSTTIKDNDVEKNTESSDKEVVTNTGKRHTYTHIVLYIYINTLLYILYIYT